MLSAWCYSTHFELLSEDEQRAAWPQLAGPFRPLPSVQLHSRSWVIRNAASQVKHMVNGEVFIGEHPILTFGAPSTERETTTFAYKLCSLCVCQLFTFLGVVVKERAPPKSIAPMAKLP